MDAYICTYAVATSIREYIWTVCRPQSIAEHGDETLELADGEVSDGYTPLTMEASVAPVMWFSEFKLSAYINCGMHLVFHGVVAYCVETMDVFTKDHGLTQTRERYAKTYLLDIQWLWLD